MLTLIRFILASEAGLDLSRFPLDAPPAALFDAARKTGWSDDPDDPGGATMCGVTLATYSQFRRRKQLPAPSKNDLRAIPFSHWEAILREFFWDRCSASSILDKGVAYIIVDWVWASGPSVLRNVQRLAGVAQDSVIGPRSLAAINASGPAFRDSLIRERLGFIDRLCRARPRLRKFRKGWVRRIERLESIMPAE